MTAAGRGGGAPCVGREDEPERRRPRRKYVKLLYPYETAIGVQRAAEASGMIPSQFLSAALLIGVRTLGGQVFAPPPTSAAGSGQARVGSA